MVEDADRLTEGAANALLKVVEEPPDRTVILLCAPTTDPEDMSVTLRSRCRHMPLVTPSVESIAQVLIDRDGLDPERARIAASISGGHVGRARRLATDESARDERQRSLRLAADAIGGFDGVQGRRELGEVDRLTPSVLRRTQGTGARGAQGFLGWWWNRQGNSRDSARIGWSDQGPRSASEIARHPGPPRSSRPDADRPGRHVPGRAFLFAGGVDVDGDHPDMARQAAELAARTSPPEGLLKCIEAVLECREAVDFNVKLQWALDAMVASIGAAFRPPVFAIRGVDQIDSPPPKGTLP